MKNNDIALRDYFAAMALNGYLARADDRTIAYSDLELEEFIAAQAYMLADAMLAERKLRDGQ
jgi:hypothetical protein